MLRVRAFCVQILVSIFKKIKLIVFKKNKVFLISVNILLLVSRLNECTISYLENTNECRLFLNLWGAFKILNALVFFKGLTNTFAFNLLSKLIKVKKIIKFLQKIFFLIFLNFLFTKKGLKLHKKNKLIFIKIYNLNVKI